MHESHALTRSAATRALIRLGLPVLVTQLGAILVGFADTIMIGKYGTDELAAAAFVNNLFMVPIVMLMGFAGGITPLVGALYGRKDHHGAGRMLRVALRLNIAVSLVMTAIMGVLYFFIGHMGQDPALLPLIRHYYLLVLASLISGGIFFSCQQMCNGVNDTATPMWIILGCNILNIAGNYVLIFGHFGAPTLGLQGAGISTLAARVAAAAAIYLALRRSRRFRPYRAGYLAAAATDPQTQADRRKLFSTSWPVMFQSGIECFLWAFGAVVSGWFGKYQLAAYQVVLTINQIGFMTYMSVGTAVAIRVANYAGTRESGAMRITAATGLRLNLLLGTAASIIFICFGARIISIFTTDAAVVAPAVALLLPLVLYQFGDAMQINYGNALRGTSDVTPMFGISAVCYLAVGIPFMLLLACGMRLEGPGVYYSFSGAVFLAAWLYLRYFRRSLRRLAPSP